MAKYSSTTGVTLVELMVGIGLSGALAVGIAAFMSQQQKSVDNLRYATNMRAIAMQIEQALSDPTVLMASALYGANGANGNQQLLNCITHPVRVKPGDAIPPGAAALKSASGEIIGYSFGTCDKTSTNPENQIPIDLILPSGKVDFFTKPPANVIAKSKIAGGAQPVYFNLKERKVCPGVTAPTGQCQIAARAFFWATCPATDSYRGATDGATSDAITLGFAPQTCLTADTVHVRFQIVHKVVGASSSATKVTRIDKKLDSIPPDDAFYLDYPTNSKMTTFGAVSTRVDTLAPEMYLRFKCPPNYTLTQVVNGGTVDASGNSTCKCLYPFKEVKGDFGGVCVPDDKTCASNERYVGTNPDGTIKCREVKCFEESSNNSTGKSGCGPGGFINFVRFDKAPGTEERLESDNTNRGCVARNRCTIDKNGGPCQQSGGGVEVQCYRTFYCCYEI